MVSRRNFFSICIMMAAILFLFQFSQVVRENVSQYDVNEYMEVEEISGTGRWRAEELLLSEELPDGGYVAFLGSFQSDLGRMVSQWCDYTRRNRLALSSAQELALLGEALPEMVLVDSRSVDFEAEAEMLAGLARRGVPLVFCNLPESEVIVENTVLRKLLGISAVNGAEVEVEGLRLFSGFLLGGEAIYAADTEEKEKFQDLELLMPWYLTGAGTKTYMVGIMDEDAVKREDFPAVIWRNSFEGTMVFAVNGDYMSDVAAIGILDAFVYEMQPYQLYPVVNAQNMAVANYPDFTQENGERLEELYSRSPDILYRDVLWPGLSASARQNNRKLTCFLLTQYSYEDGLLPSEDNLVFYLQQFKELGAEAGRTFVYAGDVALEEKLEKDGDFFSVLEGKYRFGAYFAGEDISPEMDALLTEDALEDIRTIVTTGSSDRPLLSYYTDSVTLQRATADAATFTYAADLRMRGVETALGYSNVVLELQNVTWPQSEEDQWERYFEKISGYITTYWSRFRGFAATALSESDAHVRSFLNLDYHESRQEDTISLWVENVGEEAWFVLRTHDENIAQIDGGEYTQLEEDFYLIHVLSNQVEIRLEDASLRMEDVFR